MQSTAVVGLGMGAAAAAALAKPAEGVHPALTCIRHAAAVCSDSDQPGSLDCADCTACFACSACRRLGAGGIQAPFSRRAHDCKHAPGAAHQPRRPPGCAVPALPALHAGLARSCWRGVGQLDRSQGGLEILGAKNLARLTCSVSPALGQASSTPTRVCSVPCLQSGRRCGWAGC